MSLDFTDLPDLAAQGLGGAAIACNDDFFASMENLVLPHPAEWKEHEYTDRGKWMDGWESRRRREIGPDFFDWCVVRLGVPGIIRGVVVDTAFFRGNYPAECSLEAAVLPGPLDLEQIATADWKTLVPRSKLEGNTKNLFAISSRDRFTHVRLNIFPDGGVARLRVHGQAVPDWDRLAKLGGPVDLAALENGAHVMVCSDMFFGSRHNLIKPGRPPNMSDGWETRRRRGPGNDWSIVRLGMPGVIRRAEIDTTHFKGNAPGRATLEGLFDVDASVEHLTTTSEWRPMLSTRVQPHTRHVFDDALRNIGPVSHVRLSVFPDGGVARLRLHGELAKADLGLSRYNAMEPDEAMSALTACCGSSAWVRDMLAARPASDWAALRRTSEAAFGALGEKDWLEAFAAHPRIGQQASSQHGGAQGEAWAKGEQAGAAAASDAIRAQLAQVNEQYLARHGFIYIVCATGKSAAEMLDLARSRLGRTREQELETAACEQIKITELRLWKMMHA